MAGRLISRLAGIIARNRAVPMTSGKLDSQAAAANLLSGFAWYVFVFLPKLIRVKPRHLSDTDPWLCFPFMRLDSFYCF